MKHEIKKTKLTLEMHGVVTSVELPFEDANLTDLFAAFKVVLIGASFLDSQVDDFIIELGDELSYNKKQDNE